jgi:uncharacterized RDD family membrane protein YckC
MVSVEHFAAETDHVLSAWWRRAGATIIDTLLTTAPLTVLLWAAGFDFGEYYGEESPIVFASRAVDVTYLLADAGVAAVYFVPMMLAWNGQTVGKRALNIRVIRADRAPLDATTIVVRQILLQYLLFAFIPIVCIADYLLPIADRENRAGHDLVARTRVVRTDI